MSYYYFRCLEKDIWGKSQLIVQTLPRISMTGYHMAVVVKHTDPEDNPGEQVYKGVPPGFDDDPSTYPSICCGASYLP